MRAFLITLAFLVLMEAGHALDSPEPPFTYDDLITIIEKNSVQSIDQLLPLLPESLRTNYVRMYRTRSTLQDASPENPRIILQGTDATMLLAFNGDPSQKGYDSLEVIQFRRDAHEFEMREITFPYDRNHKPQKNPQKCLSCHKDLPRPNWESYFLWPGSIGGDDGIAHGKEESYEELWDEEVSKRGRYKYLFGTYADSPASLMRNILSLTLDQRINSNVTKGSKLWPFRYAILGAALCQAQDEEPFPIGSFIPERIRDGFAIDFEDLLSDTTTRIQTASRENYEFLKKINPDGASSGRAYKQLYANSERPQLETMDYPRPIASLRYVLENQGVSMQNWSTSFIDRAYTFNDGNDGISTVSNWMELLDPESDKDLLQYIERQSEHADAGKVTHKIKTYPEFCKGLRSQSLTALNEISSDSVCRQPTPRDTLSEEINRFGRWWKDIKEKLTEKRSPGRVLFSRCLRCHANPSKDIPLIPDGKNDFRDWLLGLGAYQGKPKLQKLKEMLENDSMPPDETLSDRQKEELLLYIDQVKK